MNSKALLSLSLALAAAALSTRASGCRAGDGAPARAGEAAVVAASEAPADPSPPPPAPEPAPAPAQQPVEAAAEVDEPGEQLDQAGLERLTASIQEDIERMRGVAFPRPVRVAVTDLEGFQGYVAKRLEEQQTPEDIRREEVIAQLFGLIPAEMDLLAETMAVLEEQVGGFYDPTEEAFYLMSRFTGGIAKIILAHELTHALDDQLYDLDGWLERLDGNGDAQLAFQSVAEGSGTAAMYQWTREHVRELSLKDLAGAPGMESPSLEAAPQYVWKPLLAAYLRGSAFLVRSDAVIDGQAKSPAKEDIERAFTRPPRSMEQVLHPEKYWDEATYDPPRRIAYEETELPGGWSVLEQDTLGEMGLALVTWPLDERSGLDVKNPFAVLKIRYTNDAAEGWGGDRLALLGRDEARVLVLETAWDAPAEAAEFEAAVRALEPHLASAAAAVARRRGLDGAGFELSTDPATGRVRLVSWIGVPDEEARALSAALRAVELPDEDEPVR